MNPPRVGLPQWQHPKWKALGLKTLEDYARYFNCVEGNTTFYAIPGPDTVLRWKAMTDDNFRFCFKFPSSVTHQAALQHCEDLTNHFLRAIDPLAERLGQCWIQLPASFGPRELPALWHFLSTLPASLEYGVEVRHPDFFAKGEAEYALNSGLHQRGVNRVILDSRAVHASTASDAASLEAKRKKPQLPVHAIMTASGPMIRFIGGREPAENLTFFAPWKDKLTHWHQSGSPWLFLHSPDIGEVFTLVRYFWPHLKLLLPGLVSLPEQPQQTSLF